MSELLANVIDAHGGMDRWKTYEKVEATIVSGGGFFSLKGQIQDADPRQMMVWLHEERSSVLPYGAPDQPSTRMHDLPISRSKQRKKPGASGKKAAHFFGKYLWRIMGDPVRRILHAHEASVGNFSRQSLAITNGLPAIVHAPKTKRWRSDVTMHLGQHGRMVGV